MPGYYLLLHLQCIERGVYVQIVEYAFLHESNTIITNRKDTGSKLKFNVFMLEVSQPEHMLHYRTNNSIRCRS